MNKYLFCTLTLLFCLSVPAHAFEISTIIGSSNPKMPFVEQVVKEEVKLVPGYAQPDYTTGAIYFAWRNGAQSIQAIQAISDEGSATEENFLRAIDISAANSAIALSALGGGNMEGMCARMARHPDTVFLMPGGSDGSFDDGSNKPSCFARNILFVNGLNSTLTDLAVNQNYGTLSRAAIPYTNLSAPVDDGRSIKYTSKAFGMGMVAGKMAQLLREDPSLKGAALIDRFLGEKTVYLRTLEGKIAGARALIDVQY